MNRRRRGSQPGERDALPARRPARVWGRAVFALVVAFGVGAAWLASRRGDTDPDRLWARAERAFLAGQWDRARDSLKELERMRPRTGLDWMLEAQLATAEGHFDKALAALN